MHVGPEVDRALDEVRRRLDRYASADPAARWTGDAGLFPDASGDDGGRFAGLVVRLGLTPLEQGVLAVALAATLDPSVAERFADLDPPTSRAQPRLDVALSLAGGSVRSAADRAAVGPNGKLVRSQLVSVSALADQPYLSSTLHVHERVVQHLLGDDDLEPDLAAAVVPHAPVETAEVATVAGALEAGRWGIWLHAPHGGGASVAATAVQAFAIPVLAFGLGEPGRWPALSDVWTAGVREAVLAGGVLVLAGVEPERDHAAVHALLDDAVVPTVLVSTRRWDPQWSTATPVVVDVAALGADQRSQLWGRLTGDAVDAAELRSLAELRLAPEHIVTAYELAVATAEAEQRQLDPGTLRQAALRSSHGRLGNLGRRIEPAATLDDLVLPPDLLAELRSIPERSRTIPIVRDEWRLLGSGGRGSGISCLFAGSSGTGKTLAAEVVAGLLGVDLYVIDLSQVVDKYIGETEKNLERIFTEAERLNGVLLFDEADALFGKRSAVKDAHDRHANVEVAYLLQRMERYEGVAVLTTNLRANLDEAFTRRLDVICAFPDPGEAERLELWRRHLPDRLPLADDLDLDVLAAHLPISGGHIRNITITAAHTAAATGRPISMADLVNAASREYRKLGRLFDPARFEPWLTPAGVSTN